ncbi:MAG: hypothetical protein V7K53_13245 [Nostoc sp.]|uniref:hypothetical protein n=1 Tax=Nostoc sp. TaxID=1180 RepID=UPI002FFAD206
MNCNAMAFLRDATRTPAVGIAIGYGDAYLASENSQLQVQSLLPNSSNVITGHTASSPVGHCPPAWWVTVPGVNFELDENLSPLAEQGIEIAFDKINHLIKTARKKLCMKLA